MGADNFYVEYPGSCLGEAFEAAVAAHQWEHGHGGYTGTIAEKSTVIKIDRPELDSPYDIFDQDWFDERFGDKWGPCAGWDTGKKLNGKTIFAFAGWASS